MSDQRQNTDDQWTPAAPAPQRADSHPADTEGRADDGAVYQSAARETATTETVGDEAVAAPPGAEPPDGEDPLHNGDGYGRVVPGDPSHHAGGDELDHTDPEHAIGVASVAANATTTDAATVDGGDADEPDAGGALRDTGQGTDDDLAHAGVVGDEELTAPGDKELTALGDEAAESGVTDSSELSPGDVPDTPASALFDAATAERIRIRWQRLQLHFVDDPRAAVGQASELVDEVISALRDAVDRQRSGLEDWRDSVNTHSADTEQLRIAVRGYRGLLDRLLGL
jgi:hypothetical protein